MKTQLVNAIHNTLLQREVRRWVISRGLRRSKQKSSSSFENTASRSNAVVHSAGGASQKHSQSKDIRELQNILTSLLSQSEGQGNGQSADGGSMSIDAVELEGVIRALGVMGTGAEVVALHEQMHAVAGKVTAAQVARYIVQALDDIAPDVSTCVEEGGARIPSVTISMLAMKMRRIILLEHMMEDDEKLGPEKRLKVTLSTALDAPKPRIKQTHAQKQLAEVTAEVTQRMNATRHSRSRQSQSSAAFGMTSGSMLHSVPNSAAPSRGSTAGMIGAGPL